MSSFIDLEFSNKGLDAVILETDKRFLKLERTAVNALGRVLRKALRQDILPVTPKKTGALRKSGRVVVSKSSEHLRGTIKFGNSSVRYSGTVHEWPKELKWTTEGTGPKFLEAPLRENAERYFRELAEEVRLK